MRRAPWRHVRKLATLITLWAAAAAVAVHSDVWWLEVPSWIFIGLCLHGIGVFMHECAHGNLFRIPAIDRLLGSLCGLTVFFSMSCYRSVHLRHHRFENSTQDPDALRHSVSDERLQRLAVAGFLLAGSPLYTIGVMVEALRSRMTWREKLLCLLEIAAIATVVAALIATGPALPDVVIEGWLMGLLFAIPVANLRALAEHTLLPVHLSGAFASRTLPGSHFLSFFFNNQNYHFEHHLCPRVPWHALPQLHGLVMDSELAPQIEVARYRNVLAELMRFIVLGRPHATV